MLETQLYDCNVSSWATDKAVDPTFQLRGFVFLFSFFVFSFPSFSNMECHTALLQSLLILKQNWFSCSLFLDIRSKTL